MRPVARHARARRRLLLPASPAGRVGVADDPDHVIDGVRNLKQLEIRRRDLLESSSGPLIHSSSPAQNAEPTRITGNAVILWVWTRTSASKSSSMVPNLPGSTTNACAYFTNIVLRTKKWRNSTPTSTHELMPCSNGSSMPKPTETPPPSLAPLVRRLHDTRTASGDHGEALVGEPVREPFREVIVGIVAASAGAAEDADRGAEFGEGAEALHELRLDAKHLRHGSVCTQSAGPRVSSRCWSVVLSST